MIKTENRIRKLEKERDDLRAARETAQKRGAELREELAALLDRMGAASFDSFRGAAGAAERLADLRERQGRLEAELVLIEKAGEEAEARIAGAEDALAAAHREESRERLVKLEERIQELDGEAQGLLQDAGEVLDTLASRQHEAASLAAETSAGGMPSPQFFMLRRQGFEQSRDELVRTHLGGHLLDLGGY